MMLLLNAKTKWEETWEYIVENYLSRSPSDFENLGITPTGTTLAIVVFGVFLGFFIGAVLSVYHKVFVGRVVRVLLEKKAHTPESAVDDKDDAFFPHFFTRFVFRHDLVVKKTVFALRKTPPTDEKGAPLPNEPLPLRDLPRGAFLDEYLFFIPEELRIRAGFRFDKKGTSVGGLLLLLIVFFVAACLLVYFLPELLAILNEVAGALK
jgi:hypothetical protein